MLFKSGSSHHTTAFTPHHTNSIMISPLSVSISSKIKSSRPLKQKQTRLLQRQAILTFKRHCGRPEGGSDFDTAINVTDSSYWSDDNWFLSHAHPTDTRHSPFSPSELYAVTSSRLIMLQHQAQLRQQGIAGQAPIVLVGRLLLLATSNRDGVICDDVQSFVVRIPMDRTNNNNDNDDDEAAAAASSSSSSSSTTFDVVVVVTADSKPLPQWLASGMLVTILGRVTCSRSAVNHQADEPAFYMEEDSRVYMYLDAMSSHYEPVCGGGVHHPLQSSNNNPDDLAVEDYNTNCPPQTFLVQYDTAVSSPAASAHAESTAIVHAGFLKFFKTVMAARVHPLASVIVVIVGPFPLTRDCEGNNTMAAEEFAQKYVNTAWAVMMALCVDPSLMRVYFHTTPLDYVVEGNVEIIPSPPRRSLVPLSIRKAASKLPAAQKPALWMKLIKGKQNKRATMTNHCNVYTSPREYDPAMVMNNIGMVCHVPSTMELAVTGSRTLPLENNNVHFDSVLKLTIVTGPVLDDVAACSVLTNKAKGGTTPATTTMSTLDALTMLASTRRLYLSPMSLRPANHWYHADPVCALTVVRSRENIDLVLPAPDEAAWTPQTKKEHHHHRNKHIVIVSSRVGASPGLHCVCSTDTIYASLPLMSSGEALTIVGATDNLYRATPDGCLARVDLNFGG